VEGCIVKNKHAQRVLMITLLLSLVLSGASYGLVEETTLPITPLTEENELSVFEVTYEDFQGAPNLTEAITVVVKSDFESFTGDNVYDFMSYTYADTGWDSGEEEEKYKQKIFGLRKLMAQRGHWIGLYYNEDMSIRWPGMYGDPNTDGFLNGVSEESSLKVGTVIDRYGYPGGAYLSPADTSYKARALNPGKNYTSPYFTYVVLKSLEVKSGEIAPWFGVEGMGTQYYLGKDTSVQDLIDGAYLKEVENTKLQ